MTRYLLISCSLMMVFFTPASGLNAAQSTSVKKLKPALLVIDIQNLFIPYMAEQDQKFAPWAINMAIQEFRKRGLPIIRVYHTDDRLGPKVGSKEFEFPKEIMIKDSDAKVIKKHPSAFKKTKLDSLLKNKGINTLFLAGLSATGCVLATFFSAKDLDYQVFMLKGGLLSPKEAHTEMIADICQSMGPEGLRLLLDNAIH